MRKLYSTVRRDLKANWGFNNSIQLVNGSNILVKDDRKIGTAGLYNGITLTALAQSQPYSWDLFVKLPGKSTTNTVTLHEVHHCVANISIHLLLYIESNMYRFIQKRDGIARQ